MSRVPRWQPRHCASRPLVSAPDGDALGSGLHLTACRRPHRRREGPRSSSGGLAAPLFSASRWCFLDHCRRHLLNVSDAHNCLRSVCRRAWRLDTPHTCPADTLVVRNLAAVDFIPAATALPRRPGRPRVEGGTRTHAASSQTTVKPDQRPAVQNLRQSGRPPAAGDTGVDSQRQPSREPVAETRGNGRSRTAQRPRSAAAAVCQPSATQPVASQPAEPVRRFVRCGGGGAVKLVVADTPEPASRRWRS